jgi:catechol 2,3-dioxygenase-like lactoylglutathione lyase family enzyme
MNTLAEEAHSVKKVISLVLLVFSISLVQAQERPAITGIAFVRFYAADRDTSAAFYQGVLGYTRVRMKYFDLYPVSDSQWFEVTPLPTPAPPARLAAVAYTTRDAAALEKYLRAHSVVIVQKLTHGQFGVKDPEGNLVIFVQTGSFKIPGGAFSDRALSRRIIHVGFAVQSAAEEDKFYRDILGFHLNWRGGRKRDEDTDWISDQVPDGSDWLEYMLNGGLNPGIQRMGVMDHFSLGVAKISDVVDGLARNQNTTPDNSKIETGRDGKLQLDLFDPDLSRVEYMEFKPSVKTCCSPILGKLPSEVEEK